MDMKDNILELLKEGTKSDENRRKVINASLRLIAILNENEGKKLTEKDLEDIAGGKVCWGAINTHDF